MNESILRLLLDAYRARRQGTQAMSQRQRARLAEIVAYARAHSPYYRELYQHLPEMVDDPALLPVTDKKKLMARFDDWVTDREVTIEKARAFIAKPDLIGGRFLDKYLLATTSGTTGTPGIFVLDDRWWNVNLALSTRMMMTWLSVGDFIRVFARGMRTATPIATGGHFIAYASTVRQQKTGSRHGQTHRVFSVQRPLPELVAEINEYSPAILLGYTSVISLLASEQEAGRLRIEPVLVVPEAERLSHDEFIRIAKAFRCKVRSQYGSTEAGTVAYGCAEGWLHVNTDWTVLEPVDADYQLVSPGVQSHTVLISNLANRVQPILRYDLGDSILQRTDPCPCGDPLPAIQVQGRAADVLTFPTAHGERVAIAPLALSTLVDRTPGVELFQIVQTAPTNLRVRLKNVAGTDLEHVWRAVHTELTRLLAANKLNHVTVERAEELPEQTPGGKYREVIPLR